MTLLLVMMVAISLPKAKRSKALQVWVVVILMLPATE